MGVTDLLHHLQAIDREWDEKARQYQAVSGRLGDRSELDERRRSHEALTSELAATRARLRDAELEMATLQTKTRETEEALYGGRITAPKELESLHKDLDVLRRRLSALEDTALEAMARVDELEEASRRDAEQLQGFEESQSRERDGLASDYRALRARLKYLQDERARIRGQIDPATLRLYDELRATKGGQALSPLLDRICQTCRVTQPSHKAQVVVAGDRVVTCEGCGRILYQG